MDHKATTPLAKTTTVIHRGGIYWIVANENRGSIPSIAHPYVVIQDDVFNRSRIHCVIVCALTSNVQRASEPGNVLLEAGEGNLPKQSVLVVSQVEAVDRSQFGDYIGTLNEQRVEQVLAGMRLQQASFFAGR